MSRVVLVLNGPNLNLLGSREPNVYGTETLADVGARLDALATDLGATLQHQQTNAEGALVDLVHAAAAAGVDGAVINAGAYAHTSVALRDALVGTSLPFVEVHVSNVWRREAFRHESLLSNVAIGVVVGLGTEGYLLALRGLLAKLPGASGSLGV